MTDHERAVWAAAYALYFKEHMEVVGRRASSGAFGGGPQMLGREEAEIAATTAAVEWADQAVIYLRKHAEVQGQIHVDDELEAERREDMTVVEMVVWGASFVRSFENRVDGVLKGDFGGDNVYERMERKAAAHTKAIVAATEVADTVVQCLRHPARLKEISGSIEEGLKALDGGDE